MYRSGVVAEAVCGMATKVTEHRKKEPGSPSEGLLTFGVLGSSRFLHPYVQLFISLVLTAAAQVFLKMGVDTQFDAPWYALSNLFSPWILAGILAMLVSFLSWLYAL